MPNKSEDAKKAWRTMKLEEARTKLIVILKRTPKWAEEVSFFGDDPEGATTFMWGRSEKNYQLFIRGREYGWGALYGLPNFTEHLIYCIKFDREFFKEPETEFPKGETFVTKKALSSAEE